METSYEKINRRLKSMELLRHNLLAEASHMRKAAVAAQLTTTYPPLNAAEAKEDAARRIETILQQ